MITGETSTTLFFFAAFPFLVWVFVSESDADEQFCFQQVDNLIVFQCLINLPIKCV